MPVQPQPALVDWPDDLLREHDIVVSAARITVRGREHRFARGASIEAETHEPKALVPLVLMCLGAMAVPFTLGSEQSWSVGVPVSLMLLSGARLLTAASTYRVVLLSAHSRATLFESEDERLVIAITAALRAALERSS